MSIVKTLNDEILNEIESLSREQIGSDEYKANVDGVVKLLDRKIELERLQLEKIDKEESRIADSEIKHKQIEEAAKERRWKYVVAITKFVIGTAVYGVAFVASTNFERYSTFTTPGGTSSIKELLNIKRVID